jgi:hypothetical protein
MNLPDNEFDDVQRLLRWKRNEQPPPAFFLSFADKVTARIEAEEASEYSSWWTWVAARFDAKPVLVCAYGLVVSSLLFMGFRLSQVFEAEMAATPTITGPWLALTPASPVLFPGGITEVAFSEPAFSGSVLGESKLGLREGASGAFLAHPVLLRTGFSLASP